MDSNLDALEAAARAAQADCDFWYEAADVGKILNLVSDEDDQFVLAASPAVVLELIQRLRAAEEKYLSAKCEIAQQQKRAEHSEQFFSPVKPTEEGVIMIALSTMRRGQLYHAVRKLDPVMLMLARDKGVEIAQLNAAYLLVQILEDSNG